MRQLISVSLILILISCSSTSEKRKQLNIDLRGSWYTNLGERGMFDSLFNYTEVYVNDSTIWFHDEDHGQTLDHSYYLKGDTIFKCFDTDPQCDYVLMFHLIRYEHDTLWLTINSNYTKRDTNSYWVRFPKDQKGPYELTWTKENWDSLKQKILVDYDRRKYKWHLTRTNNLERYDSFVNVGRWEWSMKKLRDSEDREQKY